MVLAAAETSMLRQLDEVADYVVGLKKADFASEFEKGPMNVPMEKKRAPSPRDVKEFDTLGDGGCNIANTQLSKSDIDLTGVSSYSAFLAENVIKTASLTGLHQTKQIAETYSRQNVSKTSSYSRDAINTPKCSIQAVETSERSSSRDSNSRPFSRPTVTVNSTSRRAVAIALLCTWLISRLILPTTSSLVNDVNMQAETVIIKIKDTRSEGSSALIAAESLLELEEAISQIGTKEQPPHHRSLRDNKMRRHKEVKRDELMPKTDI